MVEPCEGRTTHHAGCACHEARRDAEHAAVTAERDALRAERDGEHDLIARQAAILTAVADALKGPPPALCTWSHHDLGAVAASVVAKHGEAIARLTQLADTEAAVNRARWFEDDKKLAAVTRELAVAKEQQAPLVACVDALRAAARAAGWRDADATGERLVAWVRRGGAREGAEVVRAAAMSVADDLAPDGPEASDCEWAHELMHRVAAAVARIRGGGE